ncbi:porin [Paracoccaceae bacterium]|nr:porin [Paracoccaceae bacterium]
MVGQLFKIEGKKMKKVLFATTALVMTTGYAAAEVSFSGKASAGVFSQAAAGGDTSEVFSGFDIGISASVTTDNGITLSVGDDIGGGSTADWNDDYAMDDQSGDIGTPGVTIASGGMSLSIDNQAIDDRYDDSQNGDIGLDMTFVGNAIGITLDTDAADGEAGMSYSIGGAAGGVSYGLVGTDSNDGNVSAFKWSVGYDMSAMSLSFSSDNVDGADAVNKIGVTAPLGALSVSVSADDNEDWDASASYSAGGLSVNYATDEESAWDVNASYALGGGATAFVGSNSAEFSVGGVEFTF